MEEEERSEFDAAVWKGPIDLTTVTVRISMLLGLGLLWLGLAAWIFLGVSCGCNSESSLLKHVTC